MKHRTPTVAILDFMAVQAGPVTSFQVERKLAPDVHIHQVRAVLKRLVGIGTLALGSLGYEVPIDPEPADRFTAPKPRRLPVKRKP